jgi:hypothetical protein
VFDSGPFNPDEWTLVSRTKNPWGEIPMTGGGRSRTDRAKKYMADVIAQSQRRDAVSKRHHYVPKGYLKAWSPDGKRVEVVDTVTGTQKFQGLGDTSVKEHFYQLFDADGAHNQAEKMMSVLDDELVRVVRILLALRPGDDLSFEDFMSFRPHDYAPADAYAADPAVDVRVGRLDCSADLAARHTAIHRHESRLAPLVAVRRDVGWR